MPYVQGIFAEDKWIKEQIMVTSWGPFYVLADYLWGFVYFLFLLKRKLFAR